MNFGIKTPRYSIEILDNNLEPSILNYTIGKHNKNSGIILDKNLDIQFKDGNQIYRLPLGNISSIVKQENPDGLSSILIGFGDNFLRINAANPDDASLISLMHFLLPYLDT